MYVGKLSLADFRSYSAVDLDLSPGVTALIGPNGQGKTNLVEAVCYLSTLSSHRVAYDAPLVKSGADRAVIRAQVTEHEGVSRPTSLEIEITPGRANRAQINRSPARRPRDILGILGTVLFAPEDLSLVKGDPAGRRRFLDDLLVARAPRYAAVRSDYERVLKQRNALLKSAAQAMRSGQGRSGSAELPTLDVWDSHLANTGAELLVARLKLIDAIRPLVSKAYEAVATTTAGSTPASSVTELIYKSSLSTDDALQPDQATMAESLLETIRSRRREEVERGISLVGPHRDDVELRLGTLPAKGYASQGESWSYALALRLASFNLLRANGSDPVLILDDVFSELDANRRSRLAELVADAEQVLVTAAVPEDVPGVLSGSRLEVAGGTVQAA